MLNIVTITLLNVWILFSFFKECWTFFCKVVKSLAVQLDPFDT